MVIGKRALAVGATAVAMFLSGAGVASAFSWGTLTVSRNGTTLGQGYGTFARSGYNMVRLHSVLRDTKKDGERTFVSASGYGHNDYVKVQSGRRADGESWFAAMADKTGTAAGSTLGFTGYVKVCQDVALSFDWCSKEVSGRP